MRPAFYYNDRFRLGTLFGSAASTINPVRRVADGSITVGYVPTTGDPPSGTVLVILDTADYPTHFVIPRANALSGYRFILQKADVGGGNLVTVLDESLTSGTTAILALSGDTTPRRVWGLTVSGLAGADLLRVFELGLMDKQLMPRSNSVGVKRSNIRQYGRIDIPGSEPFTIGQGPKRRADAYAFVVVSGAEEVGVQAFIDGIDRGQHFMHTNDRGVSYWAEIVSKDIALDDTAGVNNWNVVVQEVATD